MQIHPISANYWELLLLPEMKGHGTVWEYSNYFLYSEPMNRDLQLQFLSCQSQSKLLLRFGLSTTKCSSGNHDLSAFIKNPNLLKYDQANAACTRGLSCLSETIHCAQKMKKGEKSCCNLWRAGALEPAKTRMCFLCLGMVSVWMQNSPRKRQVINRAKFVFSCRRDSDSTKIQTFPQQSPLSAISCETASFHPAHKREGC